MCSVFDVLVSKAMYCVDCDTITNSTSRCMRCSGPVVPLVRWFTPVVEQVALFRIKRGRFEEDDQAYSFVDCEGINSRFCTLEEAMFALASQFSGLNPVVGTMWNRIANVESVWRDATDEVWGIIKISK